MGLKSRVKKSLTKPKKSSSTKRSIKRSIKPKKSSRTKRSVKINIKRKVKPKKSYKMKRMYNEIEPTDSGQHYSNLIEPTENEQEILDAQIEELLDGNGERERKIRKGLTSAEKKTARKLINLEDYSDHDSDDDTESDDDIEYDNEEALNLWVGTTDEHQEGQRYYEVINYALKHDERLSGSYEAVYRQIMNIFRRTKPITKERIVYRGMRGTGNFIRNELVKEPYKSLMSTSDDFDTAYGFMRDKCCMLQITLKPGIKVIDIDYELSKSGVTEKEILVQPGGKFEYHSKSFVSVRNEPVRVYNLSYSISLQDT
jgi:hypothetical protein